VFFETDRNGDSDWIDELTLQFYALCYNRKAEKIYPFQGLIADADIPFWAAHQRHVLAAAQPCKDTATWWAWPWRF